MERLFVLFVVYLNSKKIAGSKYSNYHFTNFEVRKITWRTETIYILTVSDFQLQISKLV